ncbi:MAG: HD domain-containing protein [Lachnospiraceae bacterium]|nr:HD domain-containing protein [Lachnospiraceae bacterium]
MKFLNEYREGERMQGVYMCKQKTSAVTKNGKAYENVVLQDKSGVMDAKIWNPNDPGIDDFDALDFVDVVGDVSVYNGSMQVSISRARKCEAGEYDMANYLPTTQKDKKEMYQKLRNLIDSIENPYYNKLLNNMFVDDKEFLKKFYNSSAAKAVHHGFVGGLLEHSLSVAEVCAYFAEHYPLLNRDLIVTAAICHDIGKTKELSLYPENDYTDVGNLLGHIVIGSEMISEYAKEIPDFPEKDLNQLKHCILAHHGELEYGSPKKPALIEAVALSFADNVDAKMETFKELLENAQGDGWLGYNRLLDSNVRKTL